MTSRNGEPDFPITAVAALEDALRRRMYGFIRGAHRPVTREEAAVAVGISRKLAAFHLDKLVQAGLLTARFEPVGGIRKVGRTPKVYEPAQVDIQVNIPDRRPGLLAEILLQAMQTEGKGESARLAALRTAREHGHHLGAAERKQIRSGKLGIERGLTCAEKVLADHGYEPARTSSDQLRLLNCPFHPLAEKFPELVCGINQAFLAGFVSGLRAPVAATLVPQARACCVQLQRSTSNQA